MFMVIAKKYRIDSNRGLFTICRNCKEEVDDDATYCPFCGAQLESNANNQIVTDMSVSTMTGDDKEQQPKRINKKSIIFLVITLFIIIAYLTVNMTSNIQKMGSIKGIEEIIVDMVILLLIIGFVHWIVQKFH